MDKYIAYRTIDLENDIWAETTFLFKTQEDVKAFFVEDNQKLIDLFAEEDNPKLDAFKIHGLNGNINGVSFTTEFSGKVDIYEMSGGYLIEP